MFRGTDAPHPLAKQHIPQGGKQGDQQQKKVSFQVQARRIFHAI
jgi:hypothetical protein